MANNSNSKPDIGNIPLGDYYGVLGRMKMAFDMLTGRTTGYLVAIPSTATNAQIITAINEIISRLNANSN